MTQKTEKYLTQDFLLSLTHHTTFFSLDWKSLFKLFQEFPSIIPCKAWFEILSSSKEGGAFSSLALFVIIKQSYFTFLKSECPVFRFVDLDGTTLILI